MRIGLDAMGGDNAPDVVIAGALAACEHLGDDDRIVLVGNEEQIRSQQGGDLPETIQIRHASEVIGMAESPVEALRAKPDSSIAVLATMQRDGELDACISAGNTGACVAAAQMRLRRLKGVHRPGIAVLAPSFNGPVAICDVGANVDSRPQHLHQYGIMASLYMQAVAGVETPRVGLLSVGHEEGKGNTLVRQTRDLLKNDPGLNFIGNIESRDLPNGVCDVCVCEGFVGNVVLKLVEGMGEAIIRALMKRFAQAMPEQMEPIQKTVLKMRQNYDFNEYGGAPLLGVAGIWMICHGATSDRGIKHAVREAVSFANHEVNQRITDRLR